MTPFPVANSTRTSADIPSIAIHPFILSLYGLNPNSTLSPPETASFNGTGGRYTDEAEALDPFLDFRAFRISAFFPVPLRYRSRTLASRSSKSSPSDPDSGSAAGDSGSAALVTKVRGFGLWGFELEGSARELGNFKEEDGIAAMEGEIWARG